MIAEGILMGVIILLLIKLGLIKRELRAMTIQLGAYNELKKLKKIDINLIDKDIEALAQRINEHISVSSELQIQHKKSEEDLRRMIASISHDLRTPLTSIIGYIQIIRSNELVEERERGYLETAYRRAKDLQRLISDFFTLSLAESPEYQMDLKYLNVGNILCEVVANSYDQLIEKQITPQIEVPSESIRIIADEHALKRIFENLIGNMIKHTIGEAKIKLEVQEGEVKILLVNIANGLTTKDVERMFERFYIADVSRGINGGNTGLGLAIVKELVTKMGGRITSYLEEGYLYIECIWEEAD